MFKINVFAMSNNNDDDISAYLVESSFSLWHNKLGNFNYKRMHEMTNLISCHIVIKMKENAIYVC